jgi:predicted small secreted protein
MYEKIKFGKIDLISINLNRSMLDYISSDSDSSSENFHSDSSSDSECDLEIKSINTYFSEQIIGLNPKIIVKNFEKIKTRQTPVEFSFILFKKSKYPQAFYDNFIFKIESHEIRINENTICSYEFLPKLNICISHVENCINTIREYRSYIENYEHRLIVEVYDKKSIFDMNKCLFLQEIYEKYIEFFTILKVDIENLSLFAQIDSSGNYLVVSSSYQNIITTLYSRLNLLNKNLYLRLAVTSKSKNINVYYTDLNRCTIFFGTFNNLIINSENGILGDIQILEIIFSTVKLKFNSNITFGKKFNSDLDKLIEDIDVLKTLVELNLKSLYDLILLL